jgi:ABC-type nitrate/sulfonate/bicarbonate transport system substrate-binding protein
MNDKNNLIRQTRILLFVMLAACAPATPIAQPTDAPARLKVNVQPYMGYAPLLIAKEEGHFAKYNLETEFVEAASADALPLVMQGQLDMSVAVISAGLFNAIERGGAGRVVLSLSQWNAGDCTSTGIVGRKSQIAQLRDVSTWKNLTMSTNETGFQGMQGFFVHQLLAKNNLALADLKNSKLSAPAALDALQSGAAPLAMLTEPWITQALSLGYGEILSGGQDALPGAQLSVVVFSDRLLKSPDLGLRVAQAYLDAVRQYQQGASARNIEILAKYTGLEKELLKKICWTTIPADGKLNLDNVMAFQQWANAQGQLDKIVAPEKFWDGRFVEQVNKARPK